LGKPIAVGEVEKVELVSEAGSFKREFKVDKNAGLITFDLKGMRPGKYYAHVHTKAGQVLKTTETVSVEQQIEFLSVKYDLVQSIMHEASHQAIYP